MYIVQVSKMDKQKIDDFFSRNKGNIKNPLIKNFLSDNKNLQLLLKAITNPTRENKEMVDSAFQSHYAKVKKIKYISNLIHFFSIDFDKRKRKHSERTLLVLDKSVSDDVATTQKELIEDENQDIVNTIGTSLLDHIEDEKLAKALNCLTQKQLQILEMIYLKSISVKEIAILLQSTPQNISNHHRRSLKKLYENYMS